MNYCRRIILAIAVLHIIGGVILSFLNFFPEISGSFIAHVFRGSVFSAAEKTKIQFLIAVFGPTIASWGILLWALSSSYFQHPTQQQWYGLFAAVLVWFVGDSVLSYQVGAVFAVYLNIVVAIALLLPLWFTRKLVIK